MRLDYFCPVYVETGRGKAVADPKALSKLNGIIDPDENADFTIHMDRALSEKLDGEHIILGLHYGLLYACASFREEEKLNSKELDELTSFVIGQFMDGYGAAVFSFRRGMQKYNVHFVSSNATANALDFKIKNFAPYPSDESQVSSYSLIRGPFAFDASVSRSSSPKKGEVNNAEELIKAVIKSDLSKVRKLLENGMDVDAKPPHLDPLIQDWTALTYAASGDDLDLVKFLINQGADINHVTVQCSGNLISQWGTPLMACHNSDMIRFLLRQGANKLVKAGELTAAQYYRRLAQSYRDKIETYDDDGAFASMNEMFIEGDLAQAEKYDSFADLIENWKDWL